MSIGQIPFGTFYSANTLSKVNVTAEDSENAEELITFIKGTAGNGKQLFVDSNLKYNPSSNTLTSNNFTGTCSRVNIVDNTTSDVYYNIPMVINDGSPYGSNELFAANNTLTFNPVTGILGCVTGQFELNVLFITGILGYGTTNSMREFLKLGQSSKLLAICSDAVGTGFVVFNNSPTLITPDLGTPSALIGTNITGTGLSFTAGNANNVLVISDNSSGDFQIPCLTTAHSGNANYALKVDITTTIFTYNMLTNTLKPTNISLSGTFADTSGDVGSSGQYLTSTLTGTNWVTLPTIGDGTLTITPGTYLTGGVLTFTANQSGASSLNIGTNATNLNTASTIVARDASGNFTAGTITATFTGSLTGSATLIDNTLQTTGTQFLTFLPLSATTSTGQVVGTHATLSYNVATATLSTTNMNATTFTGSLTGSSTLIDNTLQTTGTQFLTFLPLSATTSAGQVVGTHAQIFYVVGESQLNIGNTAGLTGADSVPLALLNNATAVDDFNNIQLGHSNATNKSWFIGVKNTTASNDNFLSIAPYGADQNDHFYVTPVAKASGKIIEGRNRLQTWDRTNGEALLTKQYTDSGIIYTDYNDITQTSVYTSSILGYAIPDGYTGFKIGNGANGTQIILDDIVSCKNAITNQTGFLRFWNDNFDSGGLGGSWGYMFEQNRFGINKFYTNNSQYIPLDMPILEIDDLPFLYTPCVPNTLTDFVSPVVRSGGANIYDITIKVSGHNPFGRTITISNQVGLNFTQTAISGATFPTATATVNYTRGTPTMTINGGSFTSFVFTSTFNGTNYTYSQSAISVWDIFQPVGQVTCVITPDNTGNEIDTYVLIIDFNQIVSTVTGVSRAARTTNLDGSFVTLKGTGIVAVTSRVSGSGTLTTSSTPTNALLTAVRSGGNELHLTCPVIGASTSITGGTVSGTTITASSSFSGPGTNLTGTAASLTAGFVDINIVNTDAFYPTLFTTSGGTGVVNYDTNIEVNPQTGLARALYMNNTVIASSTFLAVSTFTFSSCFTGYYYYYDILITILQATNGAKLRFDVGPSGLALWKNTYIIQYNTTTPVTTITNNTLQSFVELGSMINDYHIYKLTYYMGGHPTVSWNGFYYDSTGNGLSSGQARYDATPSPDFTDMVLTCSTGNMVGGVSVRGYN